MESSYFWCFRKCEGRMDSSWCLGHPAHRTSHLWGEGRRCSVQKRVSSWILHCGVLDLLNNLFLTPFRWNNNLNFLMNIVEPWFESLWKLRRSLAGIYKQLLIATSKRSMIPTWKFPELFVTTKSWYSWTLSQSLSFTTRKFFLGENKDDD